LNLGGDTSLKQSNGLSDGRGGFGASARRRTYQECDNDYELPGERRDHLSSSNGHSMTLTQVVGGKREEDDVSSFETESQKRILTGDEQGAGGIVVTRHVKLLHDMGRN
jgi:hypothetical protein